MAILPLLQDDQNGENRPQLVGIARLAADGEHIRDGHNVEYLAINTRSILNRCNVPRMPFSWTINPYRGCEFACKYCYARYTHEFMELRDPLAFEQKIFVKQHTAEQLRRDMKKVKKTELIAIGTATDPYQPAERRHGMTRSILEEFANYEGYDLGIVTKSNLVVRDADVLRRIAARNKLYVNITVTTVNYRLAHLLEPRAPRPDLRLQAVRDLNAAGVPAGVICAPVLPGITDAVRDLDALVSAAKQHNATYIYANPLFLKPCSAAVFMPFLEKEFPHLVKNYQERYGDRAFVSSAYTKRLSGLMAKLRGKHGFPIRRDRLPEYGDSVGNPLLDHGTAPESEGQLGLFGKAS